MTIDVNHPDPVREYARLKTEAQRLLEEQRRKTEVEKAEARK